MKVFLLTDYNSLNEIPSLPIFLWLSFSKPNAILPLNQNHLLFGRKTDRQNKTDSNRAKPHHSLKAPRPLRRGQGLLRGFQIQPPPQSGLTCSLEGAWLSKTKTPMRLSQKPASAPSFLCQCSGTAESPRTPGPVRPHPGRLLLGLSTSHSQNHFLCKTSSLRRKNALIV